MALLLREARADAAECGVLVSGHVDGSLEALPRGGRVVGRLAPGHTLLVGGAVRGERLERGRKRTHIVVLELDHRAAPRHEPESC